ncbi:hypothetical protein Glove_362g17 [Diversispora epigaea]|uniref:ZSWIM1/3 RNaseH-like domain-containing protein n=1 Tax=Diversispora epigaea TaxID=1348612 RepID=A0A397H9D2_9GLOM|nr:hypothetical protein Glove_362g17 [Diversispora epigaea]
MSIFDKENFSQDFSQQILPIYAFPQLFPEPTTLTNTLATNSIANLTTDQKRTLLFNVQQPFEVPMKEFDDEWWPLVTNIWIKFSYKNHVNGNSWKTFVCRFTKHFESSTRKQDIPSEKRRKTKVRTANLCFAKIKISRFVAEQKVCIERFQDSPDHTHNIEESDKLKRSQAVRVLVEKEAVKNYLVLAIVNAVKEFGTEKLNLDMSVKELKWREVANIKYKIHGSQNTYLVGASKLTTDIQDTILFLKKEGYQVELYETHHQSTRGFVFAQSKQLEKLQRYGWLTLIDSTHKTNKYDWRLFTLYIRDGYGCWDVGAHFFVSKEDSDTVAEALIITRRFCSSWKPRYFLADQSSIEAKSIVTAFPGLQKGEQECTVIFCTVHVMQTWISKIYDSKTRSKMIQAMHKRTKIGYEMLVQESINDCTIQGYQVELYETHHQSTRGFVFAQSKQLEKLQRYGWLTLIDSTHKTNKYDWRLFTLYIRDGYGCWDVGAHFFVSKEDSDTVAEALIITRRFCSSWKPRYFLADQSSIEAKSIVTAFPGLQKGEQECTVIFCTVHVMQTWISKIYDSKTRSKMIQAMHKRTKIGYEMLVQESINDCTIRVA